MTRHFPLLRFWPLALGACSTTPPVEPPAAVATAPTAAAAAAASPASAVAAGPTLLDEQRRLGALFRGTPVVFTMQSSGSLRVDVPPQFCFDAGQAGIKPALAAVVDRLGQSQRDAASRIAVSAAGDRPQKPAKPGAAASAARSAGKTLAAALAGRRATAVRDRLAAQGIAADRMTLVDSDAAGVTLIVRDPTVP